jgi:hypothetical protein
MVKTHTKYVLLDGCGTARMASESVTEAIQALADEMAPEACQEYQGCVSGCLEKTKGKSLTDKDCRTFGECLDGCRAKAAKEPLQFKAPTKTGTTTKARTPPKTCAKKIGQKDEGSYVKMRSEYNRLMGHYQTRRRSAAARSSEKATETLPKVREGSAEDLLKRHNKAMGRRRY